MLLASDITCSQLSVSKLTKHSNISILFTHSRCVLQDPHTNKVLATRSLQGGLYKRDKAPTVPMQMILPLLNKACNITNPNSIDIWHIRFGHPSKTKLPHIPSLSVKGLSDNIRDVFHLAK